MKTLRILLASMFAFLSIGFFSNASSEMQKINDNFLSHIIGQNAVYRVSDKGASEFFNDCEYTFGVKISDEVKESETIAESFAFFQGLNSGLNEGNNPFFPRFSFLESGENAGVDIQLGGLKLHFQSIDINGTISVKSD
ncbi:conserved hypothetical protein, secreted [Candidatus Magnetomorum sp. HK-1]|nr:conserved hypothetical protein, secreted [Candidatus Magnetomorum sp. HK-1]